MNVVQVSAVTFSGRRNEKVVPCPTVLVTFRFDLSFDSCELTVRVLHLLPNGYARLHYCRVITTDRLGYFVYQI